MFGPVRVIAAVVVGLGLAGTAVAGDVCPPAYKKVICYETVTYTKVVRVPCQKTVTKYDSRGCPYTATVTCFKEVEVTCTKQVPVEKYVKVGY